MLPGSAALPHLTTAAAVVFFAYCNYFITLPPSASEETTGQHDTNTDGNIQKRFNFFPHINQLLPSVAERRGHLAQSDPTQLRRTENETDPEIESERRKLIRNH